MVDLTVNVSGIEMKNPVMPAAGPNVRTGKLMLDAVKNGAGAIVSKTISVTPADDSRPTIKTTICRGLINCETWSEIPVQDFLDELREAKSAQVPLIVSIGYKPDEVSSLGKFIEKNIQPDGFEFSTHYVGREVEPLRKIARALRNAVSSPIWMKISPNFLAIEELATAVSPYVDGFVAINSFGPVLDFDPENVGPRLGSKSGTGWLSGKPIMPIALRIVYQISSVQNKPVIGVGGIEQGIDAIKFIMAGASAVQVCSAAIRNGSSIYGKIVQEMEQWLHQHDYSSVQEIRGLYGRALADRKKYSSLPVMNIDTEKCTGCKACIDRCIQGALYMDNKKAKVITSSCIGCGFCEDFCKFDAMSLEMTR
ncbi:diguanylate cyclase [bacterium]|nr:MAG: diguanylate cyclase [bacterium]